MAASRQAIELDKERIRLETKVCDTEKEVSRKAGERVKLEDMVKELKILIKELKADVVEEETHLDHLHNKNNEFIASLNKAKDEAIGEFKVSNEFTNLLDKNYTASFEDFCQDAIEAFPRADFNSIKLPIVAESSLL